MVETAVLGSKIRKNIKQELYSKRSLSVGFLIRFSDQVFISEMKKQKELDAPS